MELKFRAWEPVYEEMIPFDVEDDDVWFEVNAGELMLMYNVPSICSGSGVAEESDQRSHRGSAIFMQYTGLQDCNGVDIYAGDIVDDKFDCGQLKIIYYNEAKAAFCSKSVKTCPMLGSFDMPLSISPETITEGKVIGNIHMNPELLDSNNGNSTAIGDSND